jgi:hypothetical protein
MKTTYVLIDHENVQPKDLGLLDGQPFCVIVFLGANQARLSADLAMALQARGDNGRYVRIKANGRNALDFHIAFYLGELAAKDPSATFHVIAKDGDYDPLLEHLRERGFDARRSATLAALLPVAEDRVVRIVDYLKSAGAARPQRTTALINAINAQLANKLEPHEVEQVLADLVRLGIISVREDGKVAYT